MGLATMFFVDTDNYIVENYPPVIISILGILISCFLSFIHVLFHIYKSIDQSTESS